MLVAELFRLLLESGGHVGAGAMALTGFVSFVWLLYTERLVLGGPYHRCMKRVDDFEAAATKRAEANEAKTAKLEADFDTFKADADTKIARLEAENTVLKQRSDRSS